MEGETRKRVRPGKKERERKRRHRMAALDRDASMLPTEGPIAELVAAINAELRQCVAVGLGPADAVDRLRPFGRRAFGLTGSARGVRAVAQKAAGLDIGHEALRRTMLNKAWHGIGDRADAPAA